MGMHSIEKIHLSAKGMLQYEEELANGLTFKF
jgi:hypothetical protein